jgi:hypothetical protein
MKILSWSLPDEPQDKPQNNRGLLVMKKRRASPEAYHNTNLLGVHTSKLNIF